MERFLITGHRGAMAVEPENTMVSFRRAIDLGVDEIELDVHLSRDGQLVVMHDDTVDRTSNGTGAIIDLDWADVERLVVGGREPVPRLEEVVTELSSVGLQIEVKAPAAARAVLDLVASAAGDGSRVLLTSFHVDALVTAAAVPGHPRLGLICGPGESAKAGKAGALGVDQILVHWDIVEAPEVEAFRAGGGIVSVWPCNDADSVRAAIEGGFAGTTSDDPAMALAVRDSLEGAVIGG